MGERERREREREGGREEREGERERVAAVLVAQLRVAQQRSRLPPGADPRPRKGPPGARPALPSWGERF